MKGTGVIYSLFGVVVVAVAILYGLHFSKGEKRMAYVSSDKLLNEFVMMKAARVEFEQKKKTWQANVDTLAAEFQKAMKKHEKELAGMSKREQAMSEELLRNKQQEYMQYQQAMNQKAQEEDNKMTQQVVNEVNAFMADYGKEQKYKIIFGATSMGNIVYAEEGVDITDEVIVALNAKFSN